MVSSTSSERAFSSARITISKRHNWLKPDVVKALQYLKSIIRHGLLFREPPSSFVERRFYGKDLITDGAPGGSDSVDIAGEGVGTWDELIERWRMTVRPPETTLTQIMMCLYLVFSMFHSMYTCEPGPEPSLPQGSAQDVNEGLA